MKKILIIGCSGSGKSTLALKMGEVLKLPVVHLDIHFWKAGWIESSDEEFDEKVLELLKEPEWIMDGNFGRTIPIRTEKADTVIFLDTNRFTQLYGIFSRLIKYYNKTRPDLPAECPERFDWDFVKWVWNFNNQNRSRILEFLDSQKHSKNIIVLKGRKELNRFTKNLKTLHQCLSYEAGAS